MTLSDKVKKVLTIIGWALFGAGAVLLLVLGFTTDTISSGLVLVGTAVTAIGAVITFISKSLE